MSRDGADPRPASERKTRGGWKAAARSLSRRAIGTGPIMTPARQRGSPIECVFDPVAGIFHPVTRVFDGIVDVLARALSGTLLFASGQGKGESSKREQEGGRGGTARTCEGVELHRCFSLLAATGDRITRGALLAAGIGRDADCCLLASHSVQMIRPARENNPHRTMKLGS